MKRHAHAAAITAAATALFLILFLFALRGHARAAFGLGFLLGAGAASMWTVAVHLMAREADRRRRECEAQLSRLMRLNAAIGKARYRGGKQ